MHFVRSRAHTRTRDERGGRGGGRRQICALPSPSSSSSLIPFFFFAHNDRAEREGGGVSVRRGRERAKEELSHSLVKVN